MQLDTLPHRPTASSARTCRPTDSQPGLAPLASSRLAERAAREVHGPTVEPALGVTVVPTNHRQVFPITECWAPPITNQPGSSITTAQTTTLSMVLTQPQAPLDSRGEHSTETAPAAALIRLEIFPATAQRMRSFLLMGASTRLQCPPSRRQTSGSKTSVQR